MSRQPRSYRAKARESPPQLGEWLRALRDERGVPLREVAAATGMDSTLVSKIELGRRLPTAEQAQRLATFFRVAPEDLEAARIAERFWRDHRDNPAARLAANRIQEQAAEYVVNKKRGDENKSTN